MNDCTIGQFLSSLRKSKGYTQQNVADALNVSDKTSGYRDLRRRSRLTSCISAGGGNGNKKG